MGVVFERRYFPPDKKGRDSMYWDIYYGSTNINTKYNEVGCSRCFSRCSTLSLAVSSATQLETAAHLVRSKIFALTRK